MITQHGWMFLTSFVQLRKIVLKTDIINLLHLGPRAFDEIGGEVVQSASFVIRKTDAPKYKATYIRLLSGNSEKEKECKFFCDDNRYYIEKEKYGALEEQSIAYWLSPKMFDAFRNKLLGDYAKPRQGMATSDNNRFLRLWSEIPLYKIKFNAESAEEATESHAKWFPYNKGGGFRKWYGNNDYVINWENDGQEVKALAVKLYKCVTRTIKNIQFYFNEGVTWSTLSSGSFNARYSSHGFLFDTKGSTCYFSDRTKIPFVSALLNSVVANELLKILAPTLDYNAGSIAKIPVIWEENYCPQITKLFEEAVQLSKEDWDSFETSWDFKKHPLFRNVSTISEAFTQWQEECDDRFSQLKANEEELNRIFIDIYGLQDELTPEVEDKDVTVRKADLQRDIKSLLSYAVGCMFGRYSTYKDGLLFAGEPYSLQAFVDKMNERPGTISAEELERAYRNEGIVVDEMFFPDADNVIPITDEEYLDDDIVSRLCAWLKVVYGADTLEENLDYIAKALGNKGSTSREIIRNYFLNDFFKDHCQTYSVTGSGKRPIYWLFDSGKQNGFKALVYLHRYTPDTIGNLRIDYLHKMQRVYESEINRMQDMMDHSGNAREVAAASKRKDKLAKQLKECREYDEKISHLALSRIELDLDDGVKVNYRKLQTAQDGKFYEVLADSKNIMVKEKK